jgi:alkylated DNA repair dioxygenase AlkB
MTVCAITVCAMMNWSKIQTNLPFQSDITTHYTLETFGMQENIADDLKGIPVLWNPTYLSSNDQEALWEELSNIVPPEPCTVGNHRLGRKTIVLSTNPNIITPLYWGDQVRVIAFGPVAESIRQRLCKECNYEFNVCLLNYYADGNNHIAWHSDREENADTRSIASLSLGAVRTFQFRKKLSDLRGGGGNDSGNSNGGNNSGDDGDRNDVDKITSILLVPGSLLVMVDPCQSTHLHRVLREPHIKKPRWNLTFRLFPQKQ